MEIVDDIGETISVDDQSNWLTENNNVIYVLSYWLIQLVCRESPLD